MRTKEIINYELLSKNDILKLLDNNNLSLLDLPIQHKLDIDIVKKIISIKGIEIGFIKHNEISNNEELAWLALETMSNYNLLNTKLYDNKNIALAYIQKEPLNYQYLSEKFKEDKEIVSVALNNEYIYLILPEKIKKDFEITLDYIKKHPQKYNQLIYHKDNHEVIYEYYQYVKSKNYQLLFLSDVIIKKLELFNQENGYINKEVESYLLSKKNESYLSRIIPEKSSEKKFKL